MADDFLSTIGFHIQDLVAGFAGGLVNAFVFKRSHPWAIIGSIIVGGFTANYLALPISKFLNVSDHTASFVVGLAGMGICQGIIESARGWTPFNGRSKND